MEVCEQVQYSANSMMRSAISKGSPAVFRSIVLTTKISTGEGTKGTPFAREFVTSGKAGAGISSLGPGAGVDI